MGTFLAPACIFALAHLALLSGKQPLHPVADTIIAALPLGALAGLIGRAVPDTLWLPAIALIVGVASAWASIRVLSVLSPIHIESPPCACGPPGGFSL